jgi:hypothetical protein
VNKWVKRLRGAVGMGLTWAAGWAAFGILIGVTSKLLPGLPWWDAFFAVFDAPLPAFAVPGFVGGAIFSVVLGVAGRHRRFHELSLRRFTAWGALGGLMLSLVPATLVAVGLGTPRGGWVGLWQFTGAIIGPLTILSAASAAGSLMLARKAEDARSLDAARDVVDAREALPDRGRT